MTHGDMQKHRYTLIVAYYTDHVKHYLTLHGVQMNYAWITLFQLHLKFLFMRAIIKKSGLVEGPFSTLRVLVISIMEFLQ